MAKTYLLFSFYQDWAGREEMMGGWFISGYQSSQATASGCALLFLA